MHRRVIHWTWHRVDAITCLERSWTIGLGRTMPAGVLYDLFSTSDVVKDGETLPKPAEVSHL